MRMQLCKGMKQTRLIITLEDRQRICIVAHRLQFLSSRVSFVQVVGERNEENEAVNCGGKKVYNWMSIADMISSIACEQV